MSTDHTAENKCSSMHRKTQWNEGVHEPHIIFYFHQLHLDTDPLKWQSHLRPVEQK